MLGKSRVRKKYWFLFKKSQLTICYVQLTVKCCHFVLTFRFSSPYLNRTPISTFLCPFRIQSYLDIMTRRTYKESFEWLLFNDKAKKNCQRRRPSKRTSKHLCNSIVIDQPLILIILQMIAFLYNFLSISNFSHYNYPISPIRLLICWFATFDILNLRHL